MMHSSEHNPAAKWHMTVNVKKKKKKRKEKERNYTSTRRKDCGIIL